MFVSEIGTTFSDIWTGPLVVAAAGFIAFAPTVGRPGVLLLAAGVLLGASTGVKLTNGVFALAGTVCVLAACIGYRRLMLPALLFAAGGLLGFGVTGGAWAYRLWFNFGSPVFPFFNAIFGSPDYDASNIKDGRFGASSILDVVLGPWQAATGKLATSEVPFRDGRFLILVMLGAAAALAPARRQPARPGLLRLLGLFLVVAYAAWYVMFGIQRYALPLEILAGPCCILLMIRLLPSRTVALVAVLLAGGLASWTRMDSWGRVPWGERWQVVEMPASMGDTQLFVFLDEPPWPIASTAVALPRAASFVRLGGHVPLHSGGIFDRRLRSILAQLRGRAARSLLAASSVPEKAQEQMVRYGLRLTDDCVPLTVQYQAFRSCRIEWMPSG
jgi:hypothetical protein